MGDTLELEISGLSSGEGRGVGRFEGRVFFVPSAAPGDKLKVEVVKLKKNFGEARIIEIISPSVHRVEPPCLHFRDCGGCSLQHINYETQLKEKQNLVAHAFKKLKVESWGEIVPSPREFRYRNRIQLHQDNQKLGYRKRKSHELVAIDDCLIAESALTEEFKKLREFSGKRRIELARGQNQEIVMFEGKTPAHLSLFSQVNEEVNDLLIESVITRARDRQPRLLWDLYCGEGNFTFPLKEVLPESEVRGVEFSKSSVARAQEKAQGLGDLRFQANKVEDFLRESSTMPELVLLDPPRAGCSSEVLDALVKIAPRSIFYVSCDPATLVRDLNQLTGEYEISFVQCFDMFPQTEHVETFVELSKL